MEAETQYMVCFMFKAWFFDARSKFEKKMKPGMFSEKGIVEVAHAG